MCGISFNVYIVTPTYLERVQQDQGFVLVTVVNTDFTHSHGRMSGLYLLACNLK